MLHWCIHMGKVKKEKTGHTGTAFAAAARVGKTRIVASD